jgi:hypothetical protein
VTDRTRSEDSELEVVEEVLHVATALRGLGRGKHVRNSSGAGSADGSAHPRCAADIDSNESDDRGEAGDSMRTPRALQKVGDGRGCETGSGKLTNKRVQSAYGQAVWEREIGSRLKKNPRGPKCLRASYAVLYICN